MSENSENTAVMMSIFEKVRADAILSNTQLHALQKSRCSLLGYRHILITEAFLTSMSLSTCCGYAISCHNN